MNRIHMLLIISAVATGGCGPAAAPVERSKADPAGESWYGETAERLGKMNRVAEQLFESGRAQEAAAIVTSGQSLQTRLLTAPRPTLAAMEAIADLDQIYGRMLVSNGYYGSARLQFQKNITRWKTWKQPSPETDRRLREAQAGIAECDRHMGG
jgi:hypothetical protein